MINYSPCLYHYPLLTLFLCTAWKGRPWSIQRPSKLNTELDYLISHTFQDFFFCKADCSTGAAIYVHSFSVKVVANKRYWRDLDIFILKACIASGQISFLNHGCIFLRHTPQVFHLCLTCHTLQGIIGLVVHPNVVFPMVTPMMIPPIKEYACLTPEQQYGSPSCWL